MMGEIVKQYRQDSGESQSEVAERLGISRNYLSQIERGVSDNLSFDLGVKILGLPNKISDGKAHRTIKVTISRRIEVDAAIAEEIVWLNSAGIVTVSSCQGPPATALILPSSSKRAAAMGYKPVFQEDIGDWRIELKSDVSA